MQIENKIIFLRLRDKIHSINLKFLDREVGKKQCSYMSSVKVFNYLKILLLE